MALPPPIVPPKYPNVPNAPGVPPVLRQAGQIENTAVLLVSDALIVFQYFYQKLQWGIFLNGLPAIVGDTLDDFDFRQGYRIATAPQEQGAFVSYNKVQDPFEGAITFYVSDTTAARARLLAQVQAAIESLDTGYAFVMPEKAYTSVNVVRQQFRRVRTRGGVTMLAIDVSIEQVRVTGTAQFSNTVNPTSAAPANGGTVQAQPPTPQQNAVIYEPT